MQSNDAVAELKARLRELMAQRDAIEADIADRTARLNAPGQPGLQGGLLDKEGYPRSDIDVAAVRVDRHRVVCLTNDHKAATVQLGELMVRLHAASRPTQPMDVGGDGGGSSNRAAAAPAPPRLNGAPATAAASAAASAAAAAAPPPPASTTTPSSAPFAVVDEVSEGSPASSAGVRVGDQLVAFGDVIGGAGGGGGGEMRAVAAALAAREGREVAAVFLRRGEPVTLTLVPRPWVGRGLLGCHLRPLQ